MDILNCEFSNPIDYQGNLPITEEDIWNFKDLTCSTTIAEPITDGTSTFYLTKDISYFDFFIAFFLVIFIIFFIFDFIFRFIYKIKVNFRH